MKIGFIGLGLMGNPMAKNIIKKGYPLVVYNRTKEKTKELEKLGAEVAISPKDLACQVDIVITMITAAKDVEDVLFGKNGVVKEAKKGLIVIDMSTIGPTAAKNISKKLEKHKIDFLDAPVTGSTPKAITGELTIFVGGKEKVFNKTKKVLQAMGKNIIYLGPSGSGQAIKLINNYMIASNAQALSEGMLLADSMDLPREKVSEALLKTPNLSPMMHLKLPNYVNDKFPLLFSLANMRKDLGLALSEMKKNKIKLNNLERTEKLYGKANDNKDFTSQDFSVVIRQIEKNIK